jgi:hypothetical protein
MCAACFSHSANEPLLPPTRTSAWRLLFVLRIFAQRHAHLPAPHKIYFRPLNQAFDASDE